MIANHSLLIPTEPQFFDVFALAFRTKILAYFSWLNECFLAAEQRFGDSKGRIISFPGALWNNKEYVNLLPDGHLGNYAYWDIEDGQTFDAISAFPQTTLQAGLVVFFDYRDLYPADWQTRTIENVKSDMIAFFQTKGWTGASLRVDSISTESSNVYRGYDHGEMKAQFRMKPYGVIRIDCTIKLSDVC